MSEKIGLLHEEEMTPYERIMFERGMAKLSVDMKACFLDLVCHRDRKLQRDKREDYIRTQNELNFLKHKMREE